MAPGAAGCRAVLPIRRLFAAVPRKERDALGTRADLAIVLRDWIGRSRSGMEALPFRYFGVSLDSARDFADVSAAWFNEARDQLLPVLRAAVDLPDQAWALAASRWAEARETVLPGVERPGHEPGRAIERVGHRDGVARIGLGRVENRDDDALRHYEAALVATGRTAVLTRAVRGWRLAANPAAAGRVAERLRATGRR